MKTKSKIIVSALLVIALCVSLIAGTTFALFSSEDKVNIAVTSGKVDVKAVVDKQYNEVGYEVSSTLGEAMVKPVFDAQDNLTLNNIVPGDSVKIKINVTNYSTVAAKYRANVSVTDLKGGSLSLVLKTAITADGVVINDQWQDIAAASDNGESIGCVYVTVSFPEEIKSNMGESCNVSFAVEAVQGNANVEDDDSIARYTLEAFNALEAIPEGIKTVYVDLSGISLEGGLTVGNDKIADHYQYTDWDDHNAPEGFPFDTGRTNTNNDKTKTRYLYSTGKDGFNVILTGSVSGANDTGNFNAGRITLQVPDKCSVKFNKVSFGKGQMSLGVWSESFQSTVASHRIKSFAFDNCTFYGNWLQNGDIGADDLAIKNCTFNKYINTKSANNSNPIWIQNPRTCNTVIEGCTFYACRPIKLWESSFDGTVTVKNNVFNMEQLISKEGDDYKHVAILFSTNPNGTFGNVEVMGNTVNNGVALLSFFNPWGITLSEGATFTVDNNVLNGAKLSVEWKKNTEFVPYK